MTNTTLTRVKRNFSQSLDSLLQLRGGMFCLQVFSGIVCGGLQIFFVWLASLIWPSGGIFAMFPVGFVLMTLYSLWDDYVVERYKRLTWHELFPSPGISP
jgi:TRAP-type C4-dicarboxylate transport system permease small subunit